ncbi:amidohydrolase family protein [Cnuibacter physcomitrellae]|uniref:amidohydrolase family protein n=1 Tax=Cnuibacter physcomitrellae TaxID=1619308 RepID=UPI0021760FCE|nr:amidohydrolase family protein [Cnuibacter physcomitrellae]MCS5497088.1 amidohydrolase family protein [Cnuibacter physcomitrellae]
MPITDAHMHVGDFPTFGVRLDEDRLAPYLAENGIDAAMVFHQDNAMVRRVIQDIPGAYGLYWANPKLGDPVPELREYLEDPKFRGVKLHPLMDGFHPDDPMVWPIIEVLIEHDLPALIHCGHPIFSLPWSIEELIARYEDAKIILGHMGHGNVIYIDASIGVAQRHPNVWLETSGMPMSVKILEAVQKVGADRVMYGSDGPWHEPRVEQLKVQLAGLSPEDLDAVMHGTAQRLFLGA